MFLRWLRRHPFFADSFGRPGFSGFPARTRWGRGGIGVFRDRLIVGNDEEVFAAGTFAGSTTASEVASGTAAAGGTWASSAGTEGALLVGTRALGAGGARLELDAVDGAGVLAEARTAGTLGWTHGKGSGWWGFCVESWKCGGGREWRIAGDRIQNRGGCGAFIGEAAADGLSSEDAALEC